MVGICSHLRSHAPPGMVGICSHLRSHAPPGMVGICSHLRSHAPPGMKYLAQFGYLKGPSRETQNLMNQEDLTMAIKTLQKAGNITQTGVVDRRTLELMSRPRCGNLDDFVDDSRGDNEHRYRRKRYTTGSSKWPRTNLTFRSVESCSRYLCQRPYQDKI
ncbi:72 kDa type IV collagenase [Bulinus truncatus]|nr:72 kDa type IV collagenase [Bulinus truncatus]